MSDYGVSGPGPMSFMRPPALARPGEKYGRSTLIGLGGLAGAGKDTAAEALTERCGFVKIAFADPMKRFAMEMWNFTEEQLWGPSERRNAVDPRYGFSPRHVLQVLGTEVGRQIDRKVWLRYGLLTAHRIVTGLGTLKYVRTQGIVRLRPDQWLGVPRGVVITDVRFLNEGTAIKEVGGLVFMIDRQGAGLEGVAAKHASEQGFIDLFGLADGAISNDSTIEELHRKVVAAVEGR